MNTEILENIGLNRAEIKVYLALLEIGVVTTGPLVKKSGIPSSNIYNVLKDLVDKGLVSYKITANKKYFEASDPKRLLDFVKERKDKLDLEEEKLKSLIPHLIIKQTMSEKKQETNIYGGIKGIKTALEYVLKILEKGDTFYVLGAPKIGNERMNAFFEDFHKRRVKKSINYCVIYNSDAKKYGERRKNFPLTKVKYFEKDINTPSVFWVYNEYVAIVVFSEEPIALVIKNNQIAKSFLEYFKISWKIAKS